MRFLIATPLLPSQSGGPAQYAVGLTKACEARGHTVSVVAFQTYAQYPSMIRHSILFFVLLKRAWSADAVIVLDTFSIALPAVFASLLTHKKVIIRTGGDFLWEHYVERTKEKILLSKFYISSVSLSVKEKVILWFQKNLIIPHVQVIVFSTEWQRNIWFVPYALARTNVRVIENSYVPYTNVVHDETDTTNTVTWVGRDIVLKNVETLDDAIAMVKKEYPHLEYKKYSSIPHDHVFDVLRKSRMLVIPSLSEVSPNIVLEALALRVPVILTNDCGLQEQLGEIVTWVDPLCVEDLRTKISTLMTPLGYVNAKTKMTEWKQTRMYDQVADEFLHILQSL